MNIFYLSHKPSRCARWHCDKHVVKMILETTQLLYTAHWVLSALKGLRPLFRTAPRLASNPTQRGYVSIRNQKHPCAIWVRESLDHYQWLCRLGLALCQEYRHRYGENKTHSCEPHLKWLQAHPPKDLVSHGWKQPPQAMPDEYRKADSVQAYRLYYKVDKGAKRDILTYSRRHRPHWL